VLPALRFLSMLLSPLGFPERRGSALITFASVMLDSSNTGNECASAHPLGKDVIQGAAFPIHTDAHIMGQQ
jgi:hypothetical protein